MKVCLGWIDWHPSSGRKVCPSSVFSFQGEALVLDA